jgi:hypothetical protein
MSLTRPARRLALLFLTLALTAAGRSSVAVTSSYTENFDNLGTELPAGWEVWTASGATENGTAFTWSTGNVANNAVASAATHFRNLPGASQTWSSTLASGTDRALGWRAGNTDSRDGSITFTWTNTTSWTFSALSFDLFTPNSTGTVATFNLEYQIGATGTFSQLAGKSYTTIPIPTGGAELAVSSISLTAFDLADLNDQSGLVTLRLNNTASTGSTFQTVALDNFSYTASTTAIPEPTSYGVLGGAAVLALALVRRRRRSQVGSNI